MLCFVKKMGPQANSVLLKTSRNTQLHPLQKEIVDVNFYLS